MSVRGVFNRSGNVTGDFPSLEISGSQLYFIDLFAGCGGFSLGLMKSGWQGLFAIEKSPLAFETLRHNMVDPTTNWCFDWPSWLPRVPFDILSFLTQYTSRLEQLKGQVALIAGGPPCQGFSFAGLRNGNDERNHLVSAYLDVVRIVQPNLVVLENVRGIAVAFKHVDTPGQERVEYKTDGTLTAAAEKIKETLDDLGYYTFDSIIRALDYGVPQYRPRYILVAVKKAITGNDRTGHNQYDILEATRQQFLQSTGLPLRNMTVGDAISDLMEAHGTIPSPESPGFRHGVYGPPQGDYQRLLRVDREGNPLDKQLPDSHRFANHRTTTVAQFRRIMQCEQGKQLSMKERGNLGIGKHAITPLAQAKPSHTLTTLPDDLIHYSEPRILTVRESARLQSFPDWFEFRGKYTTGGEVRKMEVPRYTQVGNAVPPLMAEGVGCGLMKYYLSLCNREDLMVADQLLVSS